MRVTWRGLELPTRVERDSSVSTDKYGRFFIEPFERGFGTTVGNSLRRVLLSSLEGSAVTSIKIAGVDHEFTSIPGVMEDTTDIVLNVKSLVVRLQGDGPKIMKVVADKAGVITAADIASDPAIEVINKDAVLATLTEDNHFEMEMVVKAAGDVPVSERILDADRFEQEIGRVHLDAVYSPVTRVRYTTENTRVGQRTNYDRLILEIWTNGTISPEMALVEAAKILRKHINPFVQYFELGEETVSGGVPQEEPEKKVDEELEALNPIQDWSCRSGQQLPGVGEGRDRSSARADDRGGPAEDSQFRQDLASRDQTQAGGHRSVVGNERRRTITWKFRESRT
jgi:DNA-directed RNA polymerase subunit alpha